jgi:hypothetical protein
MQKQCQKQSCTKKLPTQMQVKKFPGNEVIATRPHYFNSNDDALDYDLLSAPDNF